MRQYGLSAELAKEGEAVQTSVLTLVGEAAFVQPRAYAPYAKFQVGCALLTRHGRIFRGCNMQSADYDDTHAEESALSAMVAGGERSPVLMACVGGPEGGEVVLLQSCGKCRQKIWEFASLTGYDVGLVVERQGLLHIVRISELLPGAFGPANLDVDLKKYSW